MMQQREATRRDKQTRAVLTVRRPSETVPTNFKTETPRDAMLG